MRYPQVGVRLGSWGIVLFLLGCGPAPSPSADALNLTIKELEGTDISNTAPDAWKEVERLSALANRAATDGDEEEAERLFALAAIQIAIAKAEAEQKTLTAREAFARTKNEALKEEIDAARLAIEEEERLCEQARIRAHLVSVVDETRRKAAAEEEYRARFKGGKMDSARLAVGGQMLERMEVLFEVPALFVSKGVLDEEAAASVRAEEASAEAAFAKGDLFALQYAVEGAGSEVHRLIEDTWNASGQSMDEMIRTAEEALRAYGIDYTQDESGLFVFLGEDADPASLKSKARLSSIAAIFQKMEFLSGVVLSSSPKEKTMEAAKKKSDKQAASWEARLVEAGMDASRIRKRGCGLFAPSLLLGSKKSPAGLLIVPVPKLK